MAKASTRIKLVTSSQIKLMFIPETLIDFKKALVKAFGKKLPQHYKIGYFDEEEDLIIIDSDEDYNLAITFANPQIRMYISTSAEEMRNLRRDTLTPKNFIEKAGCTDKGLLARNSWSRTPKVNESQEIEFLGGNKSVALSKVQWSSAKKEKLVPSKSFFSKEGCENHRQHSILLNEDDDDKNFFKKEQEQKEIKCKILNNTWQNQVNIEVSGSFQKVWVLKNENKNSWPVDTEFILLEAMDFSCVPIKIGAALPGEILSITTTIKAPKEEGSYRVTFTLTSKKTKQLSKNIYSFLVNVAKYQY